MSYSPESYVIPARKIGQAFPLPGRVMVWYSVDADGIAHGEVMDASGHWLDAVEFWQTRDPGMAHAAMMVQGFKAERPFRDLDTFPHGMIYVRNDDADL